MNDIQVRNKINLNNTVNYEIIENTFNVNKYAKTRHDTKRHNTTFNDK